MKGCTYSGLPTRAQGFASSCRRGTGGEKAIARRTGPDAVRPMSRMAVRPAEAPTNAD
jgi:hypothetical protein